MGSGRANRDSRCSPALLLFFENFFRALRSVVALDGISVEFFPIGVAGDRRRRHWRRNRMAASGRVVDHRRGRRRDQRAGALARANENSIAIA